MRTVLAALVALAVAPALAAAQWSVSAQLGVHADRFDEPERVARNSGGEIYSARGEAPALGVRAAYRLQRRFAVDAGIAISQNRSWWGGGALPLPELMKRTVFASAMAQWRPLTINRRIELQLGAGPALIHHGGDGESLLERQTDIGAVGMLGAHVALGRRLELGVDMTGYSYRSKLAPAQMPNGATRPARSVDRADVLVLPTLRFRL